MTLNLGIAAGIGFLVGVILVWLGDVVAPDDII